MEARLSAVTTDHIRAGLERMALDESQGIRPRTAAASRLLELSGVDPSSVPPLTVAELPEPCRHMGPKYRTLKEWAAVGYVAPPILWKNNRARWRERSAIEGVVLAQILRRGIRGDMLAEIVGRTRKMPAVTLAVMVIELNGVEKLFDSAAVGV